MKRRTRLTTCSVGWSGLFSTRAVFLRRWLSTRQSWTSATLFWGRDQPSPAMLLTQSCLDRGDSFPTWTTPTTGSSTHPATHTSWTPPLLYQSSSSPSLQTSTQIMAALLSDPTLTRTPGTRMTRTTSTSTPSRWRGRLVTWWCLPGLCSTVPCLTGAQVWGLGFCSTWLLSISSKRETNKYIAIHHNLFQAIRGHAGLCERGCENQSHPWDEKDSGNWSPVPCSEKIRWEQL